MESRVDNLRARLVGEEGDEQVFTDVRLEDPRTALARGLFEYISGLSSNWIHGRLLRFESFRFTWADLEDPAKFPAGAIFADAPATYADSILVGKLVKTSSGQYLRSVAEVEQAFVIALWANDARERSGLVTMLEDALEPSRNRTGLCLELPYYYGARASYEKKSLDFRDTSTEAQRRVRRALISVTANVPQLVPESTDLATKKLNIVLRFDVE